MRAFSANGMLGFPLLLHGIELGRPVDIVLDSTEWRVLGLVVHCGDGTIRFLAWPAMSLRREEISVSSALALVEDVEFYRSRGRGYRGLRGEPVDGEGVLRDLVLAVDGVVLELVVERDGVERRVPPGGAALAGTAA